MAFPLLGLLPSILKTISKITGIGVLNDASDALAKAQLSPEQQAQLQDALLRHEAAMKQLSIDEMKTALSESLAMISSTDKFVSRARPMGLYIFYLTTATIAVSMVLGVKIDATAILTLMAPLAGVSGTYVYQRTREKLGGNGAAE